MKLVVISPEHDDPRETAVLAELFSAGLGRYHVRKPHTSVAELEAWLRGLPVAWRSRLMLHQHHALVDELGLGGFHWRDEIGPIPKASLEGGCPHPAECRPGAVRAPRLHGQNGTDGALRCVTSRSCHDLATLRAALGQFDSVFFSPVFPSISKPGHAPRPGFSLDELTSLLVTRPADQRRTTVLALGGITPATAPRALAAGFDGVAVLGAIWQAADPVQAFARLNRAISATGPGGPAPTDPRSETRNPQFGHAA